MKKWLALLIVGLSFMLILAGCGNDNNENNGEQAGSGDQDNQNSEANEANEENEEPVEEETVDREAAPESYPQYEEEVADSREVIIHTNMGEIHLRLFPEYAPLAVENFLTLSEEGYYEGVIFHRVMEDFMIQGGDPSGTGMGGESIYDGPFEDEFTTALAHFRGALSMANSGPNSNSSQFFIVQAEDNLSEEYFEELAEAHGIVFPEETVEKYLEVGGTPHLDFAHTVFGHVINGMDVVDDIAKVETEDQNRPKEDVIIESVEILE